MIQPRATNKKKAECTPDEWAAHLEHVRLRRLANIEQAREKTRAYNQRPEVKARRRAHDAKNDIAAKRRERAQTDEAKAAAANRHKARISENPEIWAGILAKQRERRTGFSQELFSLTMKHQRGLCAVCQRALGTTHRACADHCHDTKKPRGILCHHCNILEGMLRGAAMTPEQWAARMTDYLANPPAQKLLHG